MLKVLLLIHKIELKITINIKITLQKYFTKYVSSYLLYGNAFSMIHHLNARHNSLIFVFTFSKPHLTIDYFDRKIPMGYSLQHNEVYNLLKFKMTTKTFDWDLNIQ